MVVTAKIKELTIAQLEKYANQLKAEPGGCLEWTGSTAPAGYGLFQTPSGYPLLTHRVMLDSITPNPPDLPVDHLCRNRKCANPLHLEYVTYRENILRGEGLAAKNAKKTHCHRNHPLSGDNLYKRPDGRKLRECRACRKLSAEKLQKRLRYA